MLKRKAAGETEGTAKWVRKESLAWVKSNSNFMFTSRCFEGRKSTWPLESAHFGSKSRQRTYNDEHDRTELSKVRLTVG